MSSHPLPLSTFSGLMNSVYEGMHKYLRESSENGQILLESSALVLITYTSLKNIPYVFLENFSLSKMFSSRISFLEAGWMSLMCTITNLFLAIIYSIFTILTLGIFAPSITKRCRIHWMHVMYGSIALGVSACGSMSPYYAMGINLKFFQWKIESFKQTYKKDISRYERELIEYIKKTTIEYSPVIHNWFKLNKGDWDYKINFEPSLIDIEGKIIYAKRMEDIINLVWEIFKKWPKMDRDQSYQSDKPANLGSPAAHDHYNHV